MSIRDRVFLSLLKPITRDILPVNEACIAAIDGGGTKTLLVVAHRDGTIVEARQAEGSNPFDQPEWRDIVKKLLTDLPAVDAGGFGFAGFDESRVFGAQLRAIILETFQRPFTLSNDVEMACNGAFSGKPGVLLLSGTGSMAWASDGTGRNVRVGGWGSLLGDEGSAYWIGQTALNLMTTVLDGRNTTDHAFAASLANALGLPAAYAACGTALLEWYAQLVHKRPAIAQQAVIVCRLAADGCSTALRILSEAADHLSAHIETARQALSSPELPWSYAGSTLQNAFLRDTISARCGKPVIPRLPPIGGGLLRAAQTAGWALTDQWIDTLETSLATSLNTVSVNH